MDWYAAMMQALNVEVRLNTQATAEVLARFDEVIIATGVAPRDPDIPGQDGANVVSYIDVLRGKVPVGDRVAVVGAGGIGFDVSEYLVQDGDRVFLKMLRAAPSIRLADSSPPILAKKLHHKLRLPCHISSTAFVEPATCMSPLLLGHFLLVDPTHLEVDGHEGEVAPHPPVLLHLHVQVQGQLPGVEIMGQHRPRGQGQQGHHRQSHLAESLVVFRVRM